MINDGFYKVMIVGEYDIADDGTVYYKGTNIGNVTDLLKYKSALEEIVNIHIGAHEDAWDMKEIAESVIR